MVGGESLCSSRNSCLSDVLTPQLTYGWILSTASQSSTTTIYLKPLWIKTISTILQGFFNQCVYCIRNLKYVHAVHAELTTNTCRKPSKDDQQSTSKAKHLCDVENFSRQEKCLDRLVNFKSDPVIRFRLSIVDNRYASIIDRLRYYADQTFYFLQKVCCARLTSVLILKVYVYISKYLTAIYQINMQL